MIEKESDQNASLSGKKNIFKNRMQDQNAEQVKDCTG
jgi:hypothetical protein